MRIFNQELQGCSNQQSLSLFFNLHQVFIRFRRNYYTSLSFYFVYFIRLRVIAYREFSDWGKSSIDRTSGQIQNSVIALNHLYTNGVLFNLTHIAQGTEP